jgi:hypothetical protein
MTAKQYKTIVKTHEALESARKLILELNSGCMVLKEGERAEQRIGKVIAAIDEAILGGTAGAQVSPQIASEPANHKPGFMAIITLQAKSYINDLKEIVDTINASRQEDTSGAYASGLSDDLLASPRVTSELPNTDTKPAKNKILSNLEQAIDVLKYMEGNGIDSANVVILLYRAMRLEELVKS